MGGKKQVALARINRVSAAEVHPALLQLSDAHVLISRVTRLAAALVALNH